MATVKELMELVKAQGEQIAALLAAQAATPTTAPMATAPVAPVLVAEGTCSNVKHSAKGPWKVVTVGKCGVGNVRHKSCSGRTCGRNVQQYQGCYVCGRVAYNAAREAAKASK